MNQYVRVYRHWGTTVPHEGEPTVTTRVPGTVPIVRKNSTYRYPGTLLSPHKVQ